MPISNSYPKSLPIEDQDLFVGTKAYNNRTVNYSAQSVADYLNINSKVAIGGQMSFQFTIVPNIPKTIAFEGGLGNNTAFSAITKLIVSAIDVSTANITIFLNYLNNSQVLLSQQNQPNFFGHYKITGYTQIGTSAFYELDLEFIGGNGTIIDKQYYDLVSFVLSTEVPATEWGSITGDIEDQTDLINYISSQITTPTLQEVTDEGNTITTDFSVITIGNDSVSIADVSDPTLISSIGAGGFLSNGDTSQTQYQYNKIYYADETTNKILEINYPASIVSTNKVQTFQDADGTIALLSDIPDTSGLVPYQLGGGVSKWINLYDESGNVGSLKLPNTITGDRVILFQDKDYTGVADITDIPTLVAGTNITIDDTDPLNPIISSTGGNSGGGGASISFYLNGSVSQGTIGGIAFREMDRTPILGVGTDFTINANGYIQSFITDANVPNLLEIPAGNWNFETYFSASSGGGSPSFYVELYKWNGTTLSLIASNSASPRLITDGTSIEAYFSVLAVPQTTLLATDRLAIRIYVNHSGRTITLHTEDNHLCQVITTFTTGLTALNGLTEQVQYFDVGTGATNFNISSSGDTHTFNLLFNIRRNANNSSNNNINYNGYAVTGSAESSAVWTITRLTIAASGSITVATATNVAWTNRESAIYT